MNLYQSLLRPLLFQCDAEWTHETTLRTCHWLAKSAWVRERVRRHFARDDPRLACRIAGLEFPNPVGIPAGFDKDAHAGLILEALGYGFVEAGSVSRDPSPGNLVRPRVFRLTADEGLCRLLQRDGFANISEAVGVDTSCAP